MRFRTGHRDDASDKRLFRWTTSKKHHKTMLHSPCQMQTLSSIVGKRCKAIHIISQGT